MRQRKSDDLTDSEEGALKSSKRKKKRRKKNPRKEIPQSWKDENKRKNKVGRPEMYTQEIATKLCSYLSHGMSLRSACRQKGMPVTASVFNWLTRHPEFMAQYERAKQESADALVEEMLDIADDGANDWYRRMGRDGKEFDALNHEHVTRSRLRIETRKWIASKLRPRKYGEKIELSGGLSHSHNFAAVIAKAMMDDLEPVSSEETQATH